MSHVSCPPDSGADTRILVHFVQPTYTAVHESKLDGIRCSLDSLGRGRGLADIFLWLLADASSFSFSCTVLYVRGFGDTGILFKTHAYSSSARGVPIWKARTSHQPLACSLPVPFSAFEASFISFQPGRLPVSYLSRRPSPIPPYSSARPTESPIRTYEKPPRLSASIATSSTGHSISALSALFPFPSFALCCVPLAFSPPSQPFPPFRIYKL